jgi:hypothetical protein
MLKFAMNFRVTPNRCAGRLQTKTKIEAVDIDTRVKPFDALVNLFSSKSYNVIRFDKRPCIKNFVRFYENKFDVAV